MNIKNSSLSIVLMTFNDDRTIGGSGESQWLPLRIVAKVGLLGIKMNPIS